MKTFSFKVFTESGRFFADEKVKAPTEQEAITKCMSRFAHISGSENFSYALKLKKGVRK